MNFRLEPSIGFIHPLELSETEKEIVERATGTFENCPAISTN